MIIKDIKTKVMHFFFMNPTKKCRLRQIERDVKIPFPSAVRYTRELEKEGILKSDIIGGIRLYSANRTSKAFLLEKKLFNMKLLYTSGLVDYLIGEFSNPTIVVFGSFARGEDIETSDIDLYIETPSKQVKGFSKFEKDIGRKLQIFRHKNLKEIKNKELANNIVNGVILNGFLEVLA